MVYHLAFPSPAEACPCRIAFVHVLDAEVCRYVAPMGTPAGSQLRHCAGVLSWLHRVSRAASMARPAFEGVPPVTYFYPRGKLFLPAGISYRSGLILGESGEPFCLPPKIPTPGI